VSSELYRAAKLYIYVPKASMHVNCKIFTYDATDSRYFIFMVKQSKKSSCEADVCLWQGWPPALFYRHSYRNYLQNIIIFPHS